MTMPRSRVYFSSLGLSAPLARALSDLGHESPTPVQEQAIPAALRGGDVVASADTGSGKTAAFVLPILQALGHRPQPKPRLTRALILVPTRELAAQIGDAIEGYGQHLPEPVKTVVLNGGVSLNPQRMALRGGADIVVATPGRLLDLAKEGTLSLSSVSTLVLDEADRLLALGFADELAAVLALLPAQRQNLLFSATFPEAVEKLASKLLKKPTRIEVTPEFTSNAPTILQRAIRVDPDRRAQLLSHLLKESGWSRILVFVATKYGADHLVQKLTRAAIAARAIHGDLSQGARTEALAGFKAGEIHVLVATDLAARGIDIPALPCVVNFDLPRSTTDYVHRIGRTGRAGESGTAVSFVSASDEAHFRLIEKQHGVRLAREIVAGFEPRLVEAPIKTPVATENNGGVKGRRKSKKDKLREAAARGEKPQ